MKRTSKQRSAKRRHVFVSAAIAAIIAVAAITVISRQHANSLPRAAAPETSASAKANAGSTYITRRVGGQDIQINTQTGEVRPLTQEEAQKLANGLAPMLDRSDDGLTEVRHADGSISVDLKGRYQEVIVARVSSDGKVEQSCVNNPEAAAKFFGIDQQLIERAPTARKRTIQ